MQQSTKMLLLVLLQLFTTISQFSAIRECGVYVKSCPETKYRSYDGTCNNLRNPMLGTSYSMYRRLLPAIYSDGISKPAVAESGKPLPHARVLSTHLFPDKDTHDPRYTIAAMQYGQIITHDMSILPFNGKNDCCTPSGKMLPYDNRNCISIYAPPNDPFYSKFNQSCLPLQRTLTNKRSHCGYHGGAVEQLSGVNSYMDLSTVYGETTSRGNALRTFKNGRLLTEERYGQQWPPHNNSSYYTQECFISTPEETCYLTGDTRSVQNTQLTVLQIIYLREHNRIADTLRKLNPRWDDERIYQEARKINIAQHQHISYYEWFPIILSKESMLKWRIIYDTTGHVNDYNPHVDPRLYNEYDNGAFRVFHTLIFGYMHLITEERTSVGTIHMSDWYNKPEVIEFNYGANMDLLSRGLVTQPELNYNRYHTTQITNLFFRFGKPFGGDLKAVDIQRGRDHGIATYNQLRQYCGFPRANSFSDFEDFISPINVKRIASLYESPQDVDLQVGLDLEEVIKGAYTGPTSKCIMLQQLYESRTGDRFFFERPGEIGFTLDQLNEIRKTNFARLLCENTNTLYIQPRAFERIGLNNENHLQPCSSIIAMNLTYWKD